MHIAGGFDWDAANEEKCQRHGVSIATIEAVFRSPLAVGPDLGHSLVEERFRAVGYNEDGRAIFVVFTLRHRGGETLIRPISARFMHRREIKTYEETFS